MFFNIRRKTPLPECLFNKYTRRIQLKPIFIQKEVPALAFSWQSSEILIKNFFKERKKTLLWEKKYCYKKRGSDIYRKSTYATFFVTSPRFLCFSKELLGQQVVLSVEKYHWKIAFSFAFSLRKQNITGLSFISLAQNFVLCH